VKLLEAAALIAAGFFAIGVCAGVYVLLRLGRLVTTASGMLTVYRDRTDALLERATEAVDRSHEQLARTEEVSASLDQVAVNMAELSGQVSGLAALSRGISAGLGRPLSKLAALTFGIRRAVGLRHDSELRAAELRAAELRARELRTRDLRAHQASLAGQRTALPGRERAHR
jgi:hypothetical protein